MLEPESEIWVPLPQTYFVGESELYKHYNGFYFLMSQIVLEPDPKLLDVGAGIKNFRCLELGPWPQI